MPDIVLIDAEKTRSLRHRVLWPHLAKEEDCNIDIDRAENAFHLGVLEGEKIISVGSFFNSSSPRLTARFQYRLRAMATDPDSRRMNSGRMLIEKAIEILSERKADVLWCDARLGAVGFYRKLGFNVSDDIYDVKNIGPHQFMWIDLKLS